MNIEKLVSLATSCRNSAYAKYSGFKVGAAILCDGGKLIGGCNVENLSFGLTICAERVAVGAAIANGLRRFEIIAIVTDSTEPTVPCGACRQVLAEFNPNLRIVSATTTGQTAEFNLRDLLPKPSQGILR